MMNDKELLQVEKYLIGLKEDINEQKETLLRYKGQKEALMNQLKADWNCETIEEANDKLKELTEQIKNLSEEFEKGLNELNDKYFSGNAIN